MSRLQAILPNLLSHLGIFGQDCCAILQENLKQLIFFFNSHGGCNHIEAVTHAFLSLIFLATVSVADLCLVTGYDHQSGN